MKLSAGATVAASTTATEAELVETPWGTMGELRARRLKPGPGATREEVDRNQRERLFGAMVSSVAIKGYGATAVSDLTLLAGVSKGSFYSHFRDKDDCFRSTLETLIDAGLASLRRQLAGPGDPDERGERALCSLIELAISYPEAVRLVLVDAYHAGLEPLNRAFAEVSRLLLETLRMLPQKQDTPEDLVRAIVGGLNHVISKHLCLGRVDELLDLSEDLWGWASGYDPPDLPSPRRQRRNVNEAPPVAGRDEHERILRGFARAAAAQGFARLSVPKIAAEASISNATFYHHFEGKEDALLAALDLSNAQLIAATLPAARREVAWPRALIRALEGFCAFFVAEPAFASLHTFEAYAAGSEGIAQRDRALETILGELVPPEIRKSSRVALEASGGAVYALLYEKLQREELARFQEIMPLLGYLMLAPLIGGEQAEAVVVRQQAARVR